MAQNEDLLGKWIKEDQEGKLDVVNIIEVSDGLARAIGRNIEIEVLKSQWKKENGSLGDPFTSLKIGNIPGISVDDDIVPADDIVLPTKEQALEESKRIAPASSPHSADLSASIIEEDNANPEHQLIRSAIKLSKDTSQIDLNINHEFQFDIKKIKAVAESLGIKGSIVAEVIMQSIRRNPEQFFASIEQSIADLCQTDDGSLNN